MLGYWERFSSFFERSSMSRLTEMRDQRIEKMRKLREIGIDPFPAHSHRTHTNSDVVEHYKKMEGGKVTLAGRLMTLRDHGHIVFADLVDYSDKIQLYIKDDTLEITNTATQTIGFLDLNLLDVGDIVEASGTVTKLNAVKFRYWFNTFVFS